MTIFSICLTGRTRRALEYVPVEDIISFKKEDDMLCLKTIKSIGKAYSQWLQLEDHYKLVYLIPLVHIEFDIA